MYKTLDLAPSIKMIISDFDGIFTDNGVFILDENTKIKKVSYKDIMGVSSAIKNNIKVAIISGEKSKEIDYIAKTFNLDDIHQGIRQKYPIYLDIINKYGFNEDEVIYVGDDINDYDCLNASKYAITVSDAHYSIKNIPHIQTTKAKAGDGAFREIVDNIIELKLNE